MSCIQDGVEWVVVGRAVKGGSWAMWWFTVSSGGIEMVDSGEWDRRSEEGRAAAAAFEEEDRRERALMYELIRRGKRKRGREKEGECERGQNFRRQKDEIRFYLLLGRTANLDGVGSPTVRSGIVQHRWSGIMNKLATCHREKDRPYTF